MTEPKPKRAHRAKNGPGLFVTDLELFEIMGVPPDTGRQVLARFDQDRRSGFPKKQAAWGGRRYYPDVKAWLDRNYGVNLRRTA